MNESNTNFFELVYQVVRLIPRGRVCTYGAIASYLGSKGSARMVGWAMNAAHQYNDIPAHRVVNRKGLLTGKAHFGDPGLMQRLLEGEGIEVSGDQVVDFEERFWDPGKNLQL
ncbi:methylated-DNA-protein-cysteine methyltransferase related protein [Cyclobacterium lianum]|uniref:Methylated-DNA-protein-cysteine methyltransferase related protein n=1 Tax=Cyclobacterium lianum TaxID=388280 RepID=A0A1M7QSD7_9BACT|nr:MGMT family protein [Cyclobacterium lianum]SHN34627.1 methylated-DNA-protein-cysteine methyltransferase related protein [Cyclobacterium lianum]